VKNFIIGVAVGTALTAGGIIAWDAFTPEPVAQPSVRIVQVTATPTPEPASLPLISTQEATLIQDNCGFTSEGWACPEWVPMTCEANNLVTLDTFVCFDLYNAEF
jgi:hypothetical protein